VSGKKNELERWGYEEGGERPKGEIENSGLVATWSLTKGSNREGTALNRYRANCRREMGMTAQDRAIGARSLSVVGEMMSKKETKQMKKIEYPTWVGKKKYITGRSGKVKL